LDHTLCHLAEGWTDREVLEQHLQSAIFQEALTKVLEALTKVLDTVRILDRRGVLYTVAGEGPIVPVKQ
jgi:quinol monooxygenase YgiN